MLDYFLTFYIGTGFGVSYILTSVFQCICIPFAFTRFDFSRKYFVRKAIEIPSVWIAHVLLSSLYYMIFGMGGMAYHVYVTYSVVIAVYAVFFSDQMPAMRIINSFLIVSMFGISVRLSEAIGILIRSAVGNDYYGFAFAVIALITVASIVFVNLTDIGRQKRVPYMAAATISVIAVVTMVVQILLPSSREYGGFIIFLDVSLWAIEIFIYYMIYLIVRAQNENISLIAERQAMERDLSVLKMSEKNAEKIREVRHDIKNQLSTVRVLLERKEYDEAEKFFGSMQDELLSGSGALTTVDCGNRIVSAVVNMEMEKTSASGVKLDAKIAVPPELPFAEADICSLLSNLIDNAAEASAACGSDEPVELSIRTEGNYLFVRVRNAVDASRSREELLSLKTSKKDRELHGCGTKIISKIAKKYGGAVKYGVTAGRFVSDVMLEMRGGIENDKHSNLRRQRRVRENHIGLDKPDVFHAQHRNESVYVQFRPRACRGRAHTPFRSHISRYRDAGDGRNRAEPPAS